MEFIFKISLVILLVLLNGFFVASEFALVSVRKTRIQELANKKHLQAKILLKALDNLDHYISATQFGITLASLALGWLGEPAIAHFLEPYFGFFPPALSFLTAHTLAVIIAFSIITFLHIIVGELAPKTVAIQKAEKTAFLIITPLIVFTKIFNPFIWLLNKSGQLLLRILGFNPSGEKHIIHSEEEVKMILSQSGEGGDITKDEIEMVYNVFQFGDISAKKVMVKRGAILAFEIDSSLKEMAEKIEDYPHSRFPVFEKSLDSIIGFVHIKDIYRELLKNGEDSKLENIKIIRKIINVKEVDKLDDVLEEMQRKRVHVAVVRNQEGSTAGIITLEDILESLVGEIEDEFDK